MALEIPLTSLDQLFRLCPFSASYSPPACLLTWGEGDRVEKKESIDDVEAQFTESHFLPILF